MIDKILNALNAWDIRNSTVEFAVHESIAEILTVENVSFEREKVLSPGERIDFLCEGNIGIEVKTAGSIPDIVSQLQRYAPFVDGLILVTLRRRHVIGIEELSGKPIRFKWICQNI